MNKVTQRLMALASLVSLLGCDAVGPDFLSPKMAQPSRFVFAPDLALQQAAEHDWWRDLNDPVLNELLDRALSQNLDLESARARIEEAQALLGTVGLNAQVSENISVGASYARGETGTWERTNAAEFRPVFLMNLFGASQREQEAAAAQVVAEEFSRPAVRLGLILEIVRNYMEFRQREAELEVRRKAIVAQAGIVKNLTERLAVGDARTVNLRRAQAELASARAVLPSLQADRDILLLRIATLLAESPSRVLNDAKARQAHQPVPEANIDPGVPAALLKNRPDIRSAEARYAAAIANIGVAEAQLYPSLRVSGTIQVASNSGVSLGPSLSVPILNRGRLKAQTQAARARAEQAEIAWRKAVLTASEEVQTALVLLLHTDQQIRLLEESVAANKEAVRLSRDAFNIGSLMLSEILEAELNSSTASISLTAAKRTYANSWAQLNVALGMGWHPPEDATAEQTPES